MSTHNYSGISNEVSHVVNEVNRLSKDEVKTLYGIELLDNGKVYDSTYGKTFKSVSEWAVFNIEQDGVQYEEHFYGKDCGEY